MAGRPTDFQETKWQQDTHSEAKWSWVSQSLTQPTAAPLTLLAHHHYHPDAAAAVLPEPG